MKQKKRFIVTSITSLALLGSLGVVGTALADTTSPTSPASTAATHRTWGGKMGGSFVKPAAVGKVTAVNGDSITITTTARTNKKTNVVTPAVTYTVDATNAKITKGFGTTATTIAPSAVAVNDTLIVQGTVSGTNVTATTIIDGQFGGGMGGHRGGPAGAAGSGTFIKPAAMGKVTAVNGNSITITDPSRTNKKTNVVTPAVTYTVDATNAKISKGFGTQATTIAASNIAVNDMLVVQGTVSGTNVTATTINDVNFPARAAGAGGKGGSKGSENFANTTHVMGTVSSISGESLVVAEGNGVSYTIDATNAKISYGKNVAGTLSNIAVGDKVFALGPKVATGVTTLAATAIHDSTAKN